MTFQNLDAVANTLTEALGKQLPMKEIDAGAYAQMRYPKLLPFMRFYVKHYGAPEFGNVFSMYTKAMGGKMQLCTLVLTPNQYTDVPLLLMDVMAFGKKRAAFVEYYDCTYRHMPQDTLYAVKERYASLPDYPEKPAWYVGERTDYSLIKGGTDDQSLLTMLLDSIDAYGTVCKAAREGREENQAGLCAFIERMVRDGNPSSATLNKVLGPERAERFFRQMIMPKAYSDR